MAGIEVVTSKKLRDLPHGLPLNMVLMGKTGMGKSETGNTILGGKYFYSSDDPVSTTYVNKHFKRNIGGRELDVVDTPGIMDTRVGDGILREIADAVTHHPEGYDAFLIVMRYPMKMTAEELKTLDTLELIFSKEVWNHSIVVFTYGDVFEKRQENNKISGNPVITFDDFVNQVSVSGEEASLGPLFRDVDKRVILVNNEEIDCCRKRENVIKLVEIIDQNKMERFSNHIFEAARSLKDKEPSFEKRSQGLFEYLKEFFSSKCTIL